MNFSKFSQEFVKVVLCTERLHRILNNTYSESLWRWPFKSEVGTQIQRQRQWQWQWQRRWQTLKVHISYSGLAQSHIVHLVRLLMCKFILWMNYVFSVFLLSFFARLFISYCSSQLLKWWMNKQWRGMKERMQKCNLPRMEGRFHFRRKVSHWN